MDRSRVARCGCVLQSFSQRLRTMLSCARFRQARDPSRALVQATRGSRLHAGLGSERPSTTTAVSRGWCGNRTTTTTAGGFQPVDDRRRATAASSDGRNLWTSSAVTHHLTVAEHRCLSQDSRKLEQQPCPPSLLRCVVYISVDRWFLHRKACVQRIHSSCNMFRSLTR